MKKALYFVFLYKLIFLVAIIEAKSQKNKEEQNICDEKTIQYLDSKNIQYNLHGYEIQLGELNKQEFNLEISDCSVNKALVLNTNLNLEINNIALINLASNQNSCVKIQSQNSTQINNILVRHSKIRGNSDIFIENMYSVDFSQANISSINSIKVKNNFYKSQHSSQVPFFSKNVLIENLIIGTNEIYFYQHNNVNRKNQYYQIQKISLMQDKLDIKSVGIYFDHVTPNLKIGHIKFDESNIRYMLSATSILKIAIGQFDLNVKSLKQREINDETIIYIYEAQNVQINNLNFTSDSKVLKNSLFKFEDLLSRRYLDLGNYFYKTNLISFEKTNIVKLFNSSFILDSNSTNFNYFQSLIKNNDDDDYKIKKIEWLKAYDDIDDSRSLIIINFKNMKSHQNGGCLRFYVSNSLEVSSSNFTNCKSNKFGGAISVKIFENIKFSKQNLQNNAALFGAGIAIDSEGYEKILENINFTNNTSTSLNNDLYDYASYFQITQIFEYISNYFQQNYLLKNVPISGPTLNLIPGSIYIFLIDLNFFKNTNDSKQVKVNPTTINNLFIGNLYDFYKLLQYKFKVEDTSQFLNYEINLKEFNKNQSQILFQPNSGLNQFKLDFNYAINSRININFSTGDCIQGQQKVQFNTLDTLRYMCKYCENMSANYRSDLFECQQCDSQLFSQCYLNYTVLNQGYWRQSLQVDKRLIYKCQSTSQQSCIGGSGFGNELCSEGRIGNEYSACDETSSYWNATYSPNSLYSCVKCDDIESNLIKIWVGIILFIIILFLLIHNNFKKIQNQIYQYNLLKMQMVFIGTSFTKCGLASVFIKVFSFSASLLIFVQNQLEISVKDTLIEQSIQYSSQLQTIFASINCALYDLFPNYQHYGIIKLKLNLALPLLVIPLVLIFPLMRFLFKKSSPRFLKYNISLTIIYTLFIVFYNQILSVCQDSLSCRSFGNGEKALQVDLTVACSQRHEYYLYSLGGLVLFSIAISVLRIQKVILFLGNNTLFCQGLLSDHIKNLLLEQATHEQFIYNSINFLSILPTKVLAFLKNAAKQNGIDKYFNSTSKFYSSNYFLVSKQQYLGQLYRLYSKYIFICVLAFCPPIYDIQFHNNFDIICRNNCNEDIVKFQIYLYLQIYSTILIEIKFRKNSQKFFKVQKSNSKNIHYNLDGYEIQLVELSKQEFSLEISGCSVNKTLVLNTNFSLEINTFDLNNLRSYQSSLLKIKSQNSTQINNILIKNSLITGQNNLIEITSKQNIYIDKISSINSRKISLIGDQIKINNLYIKSSYELQDSLDLFSNSDIFKENMYMFHMSKSKIIAINSIYVKNIFFKSQDASDVPFFSNNVFIKNLIVGSNQVYFNLYKTYNVNNQLYQIQKISLMQDKLQLKSVRITFESLTSNLKIGHMAFEQSEIQFTLSATNMFNITIEQFYLKVKDKIMEVYDEVIIYFYGLENIQINNLNFTSGSNILKNNLFRFLEVKNIKIKSFFIENILFESYLINIFISDSFYLEDIRLKNCFFKTNLISLERTHLATFSQSSFILDSNSSNFNYFQPLSKNNDDNKIEKIQWLKAFDDKDDSMSLIIMQTFENQQQQLVNLDIESVFADFGVFDSRFISIYTSLKALIINNSNFQNMKSHQNGGCLRFYVLNNLEINSSNFTNCKSNKFGGAKFAMLFNSVSFTNLNLQNNSALFGGGIAIDSKGSTKTLRNLNFKNNTSTYFDNDMYDYKSYFQISEIFEYIPYYFQNNYLLRIFPISGPKLQLIPGSIYILLIDLNFFESKHEKVNPITLNNLFMGIC
ncbi:hypothetical protein ABPG72_005460 [Tetrahymena utriculariae]